VKLSDTSKSLGILLIGPIPPPPTGQSIAFETLIEGLLAEDITAVINLSERHGRRDAAFSLRRATSILRALANVWRHSRAARVMYLQIAQSRWGFLRDLLFIIVARWRGLPIVAHFHGGGYLDFFLREPFAIQCCIRWALARISVVIVLSDALRDNFSFMGSDYDRRLRVIANACPIEIAQPRTAPTGGLRLLYLSNLLVEKGYLDCVDALSHLHRPQGHAVETTMPAHLVLAGAPLLGADEYSSAEDLLSALQKHIRYLELEKHVTLAGVVEGAEKDRLLREADIALLPTYYRNEGQPIALIEAMASGLPIITTDWRGIAEMVGAEDTAILVPPKAPLAIADAIALIGHDPALYERLSANAISRAALYTPARHVAQIRDVLHEVQMARVSE
jgi:glycosyltransferase involved in cell wall biosynthesis